MGDIAKVDGQVLSDYLFRKEISLSMAVENHWHGFIGMSPTANAPELFNLIYEKIFDPELKYDEFEEIRQDLLENQDKETILEKMLQRSPDRLLSARINELTGTGFARSSQKLSSEQIKNLNLDSIAAFYKSSIRIPKEPPMSFAAISMRTLSCSSLSPFSDVFLFRHICPDFLIRISIFQSESI